jgi:hypothetical protein
MKFTLLRLKMKSLTCCLALLAAAAFWKSSNAHGAITLTNYYVGLNQPIPDGTFAGTSDTRTITTGLGPILNVSVTMNVVGTGEGAFNGDFYAYLSHGSGLTVLLNRPGATPPNPNGYNDDGFSNVRFDDDAPNGDVHNYRITLFGDPNTSIMPFPSPLTGTWVPDGRTTFPLATSDTDPTPARFNVFDGMNPNGEWTFFIADVVSGNTALLTGWSLELTLVPEPSTYVLAGLCLAPLLWRRRDPKS